MDMKGRLAALVLLGFLGVFAASAWGQACTPVVYAFRHAEDTNPTDARLFALTQTGQAHADLYPAMIRAFEPANLEAGGKPTLCPVTKVYATTTKRKEDPCGGSCDSATNAFYTAKPLAHDAMNADPITTVAHGSLQLYEYVGNGNGDGKNPPPALNYSNPTAVALREELLATANLGQSSAIFWTSQGLHALGGAIIGRSSHVPVKDGWVLPGRNAVYIFIASGSAPHITEFADTPLASVTKEHPVASAVFVQCFNWVGPTTQPIPNLDKDRFVKPTGSPPTQDYYCGFNDQSSLGGKPKDSCDVNTVECSDGSCVCGTIPNNRNPDIKGKICDTTYPTIMLPNTHGAGIFGACR
jgi:hypothetical protein